MNSVQISVQNQSVNLLFLSKEVQNSYTVIFGGGKQIVIIWK